MLGLYVALSSVGTRYLSSLLSLEADKTVARIVDCQKRVFLASMYDLAIRVDQHSVSLSSPSGQVIIQQLHRLDCSTVASRALSESV